MAEDKEKKGLVSVYLSEDLAAWLDREAEADRRSRSSEVVYFLEEARRVREHNRKAMADRAGLNKSDFTPGIDLQPGGINRAIDGQPHHLKRED